MATLDVRALVLSDHGMDLDAAVLAPFSPTAMHERFAALVGTWSGRAKTYADEKNPEAFEEAEWAGEMRTVLGGRFLRFVYASRAFGKPFAGELTLAYESDGALRMAWLDSLHTSPAIMVSEGKVEDGGELAALGSYFAGEGAPRWGWRTVLDDHDPEALTIRMFNISPSGEETMGVLVELVR